MADEVYEKLEEDQKGEETVRNLNIDEANILDQEQKQRLTDLLRFRRRLCNLGVLRVEFIVFALSYIDFIFVMIFQILFMRYRAISY